MKATETNLLTLLKKSEQFIIPIYQRTYSWTRRECQQLLDDTFRAGENNQVRAHFVGSFVYIEKGLYSATTHHSLMVIDGQQRLTTITLLLEALARQLGDAEPLDGFTAEKIRRYYLVDDLKKGDDCFKLLLTQTDKETLLAIVQQQEIPDKHSVRIVENFDFFIAAIEAISEEHLKELCMGVSKLTAVDIALDREQDNPQLIFESMNSTGLDLSQADLIRNYVLMDLESGIQASLYKNHWRPMELGFGQQAYSTNFDSFMRHYLTVKTGEIPKINAVYEAFKSYASQPEVEDQGINALVQDLQAYSRYYCAFALDKEEDAGLKEAFQDLKELRADVVYPLLLELYADYENGVLSKDDLVAAVRLIESYIFRRAVCAIPTNSHNKTFSTFGKSLRKDRYLESLQAAFLLLPSYRRYPSDDEFTRELRTRDLYNFQRRSYWLRRVENYGRKERVSVDEYTIEHVMPQNEKLSDEWQLALGWDWERVHAEKLHTLGNLTLTAYNSEYSDRPFIEKRDLEIKGIKVGLGHSPLHLNEGLGDIDVWDEAKITERANRLASLALSIWVCPLVQEETLATYRPEKPHSSYTIDDHSELVHGSAMRDVFDILRQEILALDPCVSEEFKKLYVAYKAETNFVDVVPQAKKLNLFLNLDLHELNDPRAIAIDVSEVGTWGNGDVMVHLDSPDDLLYAVGLIRQALEKQLDGS